MDLQISMQPLSRSHCWMWTEGNIATVMSNRIFQVSALLVLFIAVGSAQSGPKLGFDVTDEPHYRLLLDNSSVRAFRLELLPGQATELHWHDYDFMTVTLEDSTVNEMIMRPATAEDARAHVLSQGDMATYELKKQFGDAWRTPAGIVHTISNKSDKPYRNVTFEIKQGHASVADGQALMLRPGDSATREWEKNDHLLIAMNDLEASDVAGEKQNTIRLKAGEVAWIAHGATHSFTNIGTKGALATTFEFQPNGR